MELLNRGKLPVLRDSLEPVTMTAIAGAAVVPCTAGVSIAQQRTT